MDANNLLKLEEIFRAVLNLSLSADLEALSMMNSSKWDSLGTVNLITTIEGEFNIRLDVEDYEMITSYNSTVLLLSEMGL